MEAQNNSHKPTAIITSGGGMKCAYSAGALVALAKHFKFTEPDIFVAASGSVGAMYYYLAGQYDEIQKVWTRYLPSSSFIRYAPFPSMRINYLVDTIARDYVPLEIDKLEKTKTRFFVPITDVESGRHRFVGNEFWFNPYEVTRAATAIPILYNGHVRLGSRTYLDGDFTTSLATLIRKALDEGARRIICITNTKEPGKLAKAFFKAYAAFLHPNLRTMFLTDLEGAERIDWPDDMEFICVSPSFPLPAVIYSRNRREIIETFNMGYDDLMAKSEELERLLKP